MSPSGCTMLSLTAEAATLLSALADAEAPGRDVVPRLEQDEAGFGLSFDQPRDTDVVMAYDGRVVLVVDNGLALRLGDCALAINQTPSGPELALVDTAAGLPAVTLDAGAADAREPS